MKAYIKKVLGKFARFYHRIRSHDVIRNFLNRKGRMLLKKHQPVLSDTAQKILKALREDGIAIVHISELLPESIFTDLAAYVDARWNDPSVVKKYNERDMARSGDSLHSKEYFLVNLWTREKELDLLNPFLRFSLNEHVLNIVNSYLGTFSKFRAWYLQATIPMSEGDRRYGSQEWHRDPEDKMLVKTFLYLKDVEEGAGPFMYLKKSQSGGAWRKLFPQSPPRGSAGKEEQIPKEDVVVCTGKAGTLIFCDTTGLHRGGYATTDVRFMYTSVYTTPASVWPILYSYKEGMNPSNLSLEASFAIQNDPYQKEPKFYKF